MCDRNRKEKLGLYGAQALCIHQPVRGRSRYYAVIGAYPTIIQILHSYKCIVYANADTM
jgi:hypothetical protein